MPAEKLKILVTGAGGFTGSHISQALVNAGHEVFGLIRKNREKISHLVNQPSFHAVQADLADFGAINKLVHDIRPVCVLHVGALHTPEKIDSPFPFFEDNEKATLNILEASRLAGVQKFLYLSSMSVYDKSRLSLPVGEEHPVKPGDFYSTTKYIGEIWSQTYATMFNLPVVILRCVGIYGPRRYWGAVSNFIKSALAGESLEINANLNWDMVGVTDVAQAAVQAVELALDSKFEIINIGGGQEINILDLAKLIIREAGTPSAIKFGEGYRPETDFHFYFDISKAKKLLHFNPVPLATRLKEYITVIKKGTAL